MLTAIIIPDIAGFVKHFFTGPENSGMDPKSGHIFTLDKPHFAFARKANPVKYLKKVLTNGLAGAMIWAWLAIANLFRCALVSIP